MRTNRPMALPLFTGIALMAACGPAVSEFGAAVTLADAGASNPTIATDAATGATYAAWVGNEGHDSDVWLTALGEDGTVGSPVRVNDVAGDAAPHLQAPAQVAVGPEGNVYVVWTNSTIMEGRRFPASNLRFARSVDGGRTFESALTVNDDAGGPPTSHTFHNIVVSADGTVVVSWLDNRRGAAFPAGETEGEAGHAVAGEHPAPGPDARVAVSTDGGVTFSESRIVDMQACPCCRTSMASGPDGTLYLAWRKIFEGDIRDIVVARSRDKGATWDEPRRVAADDWVFPGCPHAGPSLTVDPVGTLHVGWYTGRAGSPGLYYVRSEDSGETFSDPVTLLSDVWVPPSQVGLSADADGTLRLVWEDRRSDQQGFWYTVARDGVFDPDDAAFTVGTNPVLATGAGHTALAWLEGDRILARTSGAGR